jgi:hypothetical protein
MSVGSASASSRSPTTSKNHHQGGMVHGRMGTPTWGGDTPILGVPGVRASPPTMRMPKLRSTGSRKFLVLLSTRCGGLVSVQAVRVPPATQGILVLVCTFISLTVDSNYYTTHKPGSY